MTKATVRPLDAETAAARDRYLARRKKAWFAEIGGKPTETQRAIVSDLAFSEWNASRAEAGGQSELARRHRLLGRQLRQELVTLMRDPPKAKVFADIDGMML
jgi:hypothetical protein